jgi:predicted metalloprotease
MGQSQPMTALCPVVFQFDHDRIGPARDHPVLVLAPAIGVAEGTVRAGRGIRPQPRRDIHRQDQPAISRPRQRQFSQNPTQTADLDPPLVEPAVEGSVTAAVFRSEREVDQRPHRSVRAQQRVTRLEQRVAPRGQTRLQLRPEA